MVKIMAIINASPESFSGDGSLRSDVWSARISQAIKDGADILDIGGESTKPGSSRVTPAQEASRVLPAIELARSMTAMPISVDTSRAVIAEAAIRTGATIVNDVRGLHDPEMARVVARSNASIVVVHSKGASKQMYRRAQYPRGVEAELDVFFRQRLSHLKSHGVEMSRVMIDPGIGFSKTPEQSFHAVTAILNLRRFGCDVVFGGSNKSFLAASLANIYGREVEVGERANANTAIASFAMLFGADILRVHDVKTTVEARCIFESIMDGNEHFQRNEPWAIPKEGS